MIVADAHVHLYRMYDLAAAFAHAFRNLAACGGAADGAAQALLLAERFDHRVFRDLAGGRAASVPGFAVARTLDPEALIVRRAAPPGVLYLVAGRQVVTAERLEVLALTTDAEIPDGRPLGATLAAIRESNGVPVLSWAPGKWMFARGKRVRELLRTASAADVLLGDSTLHPAGLPEPPGLRRGRERGFTVAAGSDPLPFAGEERLVGSLAVRLEAVLDPEAPVHSLRAALRARGADIHIVGRRPPVWRTALRLYRNHAARKAAAGGVAS